jgi:glycosyltransferase GT-like protein
MKSENGSRAASQLLNGMKRVLPVSVKRYGREFVEPIARMRLKASTISRQEYLADIRSAIDNGRGYAAAKIGASQKCWMYYPIFLQRYDAAARRDEFEEELIFHSLRQEGLFPAAPAFYLEFNQLYIEHVRNLDCLGICLQPAFQELEIIHYYGLNNKLIYYPLQEPASTDGNCYLPAFRDKRMLIVCPFAGVLQQRARQEIFEGVWQKTGKKWFHPASVEALEFPYGFASDTHRRYATVLDLFDEIVGRIEKCDFDVALIGAGGLAIPIASHIKGMGKVAIDLGGHLQIVFGVIGQRWRQFEDMKRNYFTEHWIDMPPRYKPQETDVCDGGAYW